MKRKNNEGDWNADVHLALYEFPHGYEFHPAKKVYVRDQFDKYSLDVKKSMYLGVPTKKLQ